MRGNTTAAGLAAERCVNDAHFVAVHYIGDTGMAACARRIVLQPDGNHLLTSLRKALQLRDVTARGGFGRAPEAQGVPQNLEHVALSPAGLQAVTSGVSVSYSKLGKLH